MTWNELCPAVGDLTARDLDAAVLAHLRRCRRCAVLAREFRTSLEVQAVAESLDRRQPTWRDELDPRIGEVYCVRSPERDGLEPAVVVALEDRDAAVLTIRDGNAPALGCEVILDDAVLGFAASVAPDLGGWVLPEQLDGRLGVLPPDQMRSLPVPARAPTGDEEQSREAPLVVAREGLEPYFEPARSLTETQTLGELLVVRQASLGITSADVASAEDLTEAEFEAIKDDRADLLTVVSPQAFGGVLRRLRVLFSAKLGERITLALMASGCQGSLSAAHRLARIDTQPQLNQAFRNYVADVRDSLQD